MRSEVQHFIILYALRLRGLVLRELVSSPLLHVLRLRLDVSYIGAELPSALVRVILGLDGLRELWAVLVVSLIAIRQLRRFVFELHLRFRFLGRSGYLWHTEGFSVLLVYRMTCLRVSLLISCLNLEFLDFGRVLAHAPVIVVSR